MEDIKVTLSSSKVNAALTEMARIKRDNPNDKIVVVSQFTSFLSVIQGLLREQGFDYVRLDGTMNHDLRADVIKEFQRKGKGSPKVLLLSLKVIFTISVFLIFGPSYNVSDSRLVELVSISPPPTTFCCWIRPGTRPASGSALTGCTGSARTRTCLFTSTSQITPSRVR